MFHFLKCSCSWSVFKSFGCRLPRKFSREKCLEIRNSFCCLFILFWHFYSFFAFLLFFCLFILFWGCWVMSCRIAVHSCPCLSSIYSMITGLYHNDLLMGDSLAFADLLAAAASALLVRPTGMPEVKSHVDWTDQMPLKQIVSHVSSSSIWGVWASCQFLNC